MALSIARASAGKAETKVSESEAEIGKDRERKREEKGEIYSLCKLQLINILWQFIAV